MRRSSVLNNLLSSARFARLIEQRNNRRRVFIPAVEFLADVRKGIWKELDAPQVKVDAYRRNLQRAYLDLANTKVNGVAGPPPGLPPGFPVAMFATSGDEKPLYRAELRTLNSALGAALEKAADKPTRAHIEAARDQISRILDPKFATPSPAGSGGVSGHLPTSRIAAGRTTSSIRNRRTSGSRPTPAAIRNHGLSSNTSIALIMP